MSGFKIALNIKKPGNYAFFCPSSRLHLTLSHPVAITDRVTSSIIHGIRFGKLIDVDGAVAKYINGETVQEQVPEKLQQPEIAEQTLETEQQPEVEQVSETEQLSDMFDNLDEQAQEEQQEQPKKKAGRKSKKKQEQPEEDIDKPLE